MFTVFEKTLKTDTGKTLVRSHINDHDAQKIFRDLSTYSLTSTKASLDSSTILSYTTSARLGDGSWKNGTHAFILHWLDQVRKYKALVPVAVHSSECPKKTMLQNAVHNIDELNAVEQQADQHKTQSRVDLTYLQYCNLLLSAVTKYDLQFNMKKSSKTSYQQV